jgi:hypothetical protein
MLIGLTIHFLWLLVRMRPTVAQGIARGAEPSVRSGRFDRNAASGAHESS